MTAPTADMCGDVLDRKACEIRTCSFRDIRHILEEFHYKKGAIGGGISVCFAMLINGALVGGSVLGKPRHQDKYKRCIDIRRMACIDAAPKNSESWFLGQIIRWCASNTNYDHVLSYSDTTEGHCGTIYKAANFEPIGQTAPSEYVMWKGKKYHTRSLRNDRPYSYKLRDAVASGEAIIESGLPKIIWIYTIGDKMKKKNKRIKPLHGGNDLFEQWQTMTAPTAGREQNEE